MTEKSYKKIYIHQLRKGTKYLGWKSLSDQDSEAFFVKLKYYVMCQCRHYRRHVCAKIDDIQMKIIADPKDGSLS